MGKVLWSFTALGVLAVLVAVVVTQTRLGRHWAQGVKAELSVRRVVWQMPGVSRRAHLRVPMADGIDLATDVYVPDGDGAHATVLIRTPYGKTRTGEAMHWVRLFAPKGYAVVVQDMRGRWGSDGVFAPWPNAAPDGVATLDWIAAQPWSNGRVGTIGCSALGEHQWSLAAERHPAHQAMIALGSGGAAGEIEGLWNFFGMWEGGIYTWAPALGWFTIAGGKTWDKMAPLPLDHSVGLTHLPLRDAVKLFRADPTDHEALLEGFRLGVGRGQGYLDGTEVIGPAVLVGDTWFDHSVHGSLALWRLAARTAPAAHAIIGPGTHCDATGPFRSGVVGDFPVALSSFDADAAYLAFFDHHLRDGPRHRLPPVRSYALGEDRWEDHGAWPPEGARPHALTFLDPSWDGVPTEPVQIPVDPYDPVPSVGGALCCTGDPSDRSGPLDQRPIEIREDVFVVTSPPLTAPLALAGPMEARLKVASDRPDGDVILRLTEVFPDGRSITIQEGGFRLRYRHSFAEPQPMQPGVPDEVRFRLRDTRRTVPAGHRLRIHIAGSSFPRLERPPGVMLPPGRATELHRNTLTIYNGVELRVTSLTAPEFGPS